MLDPSAEDFRPRLDPFADDFRPLMQLLDELPIRPSPAVVCRWHLRGANGTKLEVLRIAGKLFTTRTELRRFLQDSQRPLATLTERDHQLDAALEEAGLLRAQSPKRQAQKGEPKPSAEQPSAVRESEP